MKENFKGKGVENESKIQLLEELIDLQTWGIKKMNEIITHHIEYYTILIPLLLIGFIFVIMLNWYLRKSRCNYES